MNLEAETLCPTCRNQFDGKMPGWKYGSNWDWVPCQTCNGKGFAPAASPLEPKETK